MPSSAARAVRHPCEVPTTCQPPSGWAKDPWSAVIRDIAADGLSLSLARRFEPGSGLAIELPGEGGVASTVLARVAELTPLSGGGWLVDCALISELGDDEVLHVLHLDPLHQAMLGDTEVITDITAITSTIVHDVLFRAVGARSVLRWLVKRLDLYGCWPLAPGKRVAFRVGGLPAATPPVELTVQRCVSARSFWVVDGQLAGPPGVEVLRLLTASPPSG